MKISRFYLRLFLHPNVMFLYFRRWLEFGERPPKETMLISNRLLTKDEYEHGASLENQVLQILKRPN